MKRKAPELVKVPKLDPSLLPVKIRNAALRNRNRIRKGGLPTYIEQMLYLHAPPLIRAYFEQMYKLVASGNPEALKETAIVFGVRPGHANGPNIVLNNILQNGSGPADAERSFDQIARRLNDNKAAQKTEVIDIKAG